MLLFRDAKFGQVASFKTAIILWPGLPSDAAMGDVGEGMGLTPAVASAVEPAVALVLEVLQDFRNDREDPP